MSKAKRFAFKAARKSAHITNKALHKTLHFTTRVENKAGRILEGSDLSHQSSTTIPLEKAYYGALKYITPLNPALPVVGQKASIVLLLPTLDGKSFYGGTATALIVAGRAAELQRRPLRIVQTLKTGQAKDLSIFFKEYGITLSEEDISIVSVADRAYNVYGYLPMHPEDIYVASAWWDAYLLNQLPLTRKYIYLIQDFEPIFYNNSDSYVLAESTYKTDGFVPFCNTKLMYDFMKDRNYPVFQKSTARWFEPAVSRVASGKKVIKTSGERKSLFLYGRPDVHRNLFFTALNALDYSFKSGFLKNGEWDLFMAGQDGLPNIKLSAGPEITNLGKMSMDDYIAFSKTVDVAISPMMAPHPNYPTLEFASIGSTVVTTRYANKTDLSKYSNNIVLSDIDAESMAGAINIAANKSAEDIEKDFQQTTINENWANALDEQLQEILKSL